MAKTLKVLLVAQTPPPYHGQAVMMERVRDGIFEGVQIKHVRMHFSEQLTDVGRFSLRKALLLVALALQIAFSRVRFGASTLYYPPAGPNKIPVYRDLAVLIATRWMFKHTILHFQAAGVSEIYPRLVPFTRWLFRAAYFRPDVAIRTDEFAPADPQFVRARREFLIPNALEDAPGMVPLQLAECPTKDESPPVILFVGALRESKGVLDLMRAASELKRRGIPFRLKLVGEFDSTAFEMEARGLAHQLSLPVDFTGLLVGQAKLAAFGQAEVFCLPTYYQSEASPVVLVEAMRASLPIVSTKWRGIPAMVADGINGFLVPTRDSGALADRLEALLRDPNLAAQLGRNSRRRYEDNHTIEAFYSRLQAVFDEVARSRWGASL